MIVFTLVAVKCVCVCVIMRCSSEAVNNLWEAVNAVCTAFIYNIGAVFFECVSFKRGMSTVSCMTTSLYHASCIMFRIYSAAILVLAINALMMKQTVDFFCFAVVERLRAELISK